MWDWRSVFFRDTHVLTCCLKMCVKQNGAKGWGQHPSLLKEQGGDRWTRLGGRTGLAPVLCKPRGGLWTWTPGPACPRIPIRTGGQSLTHLVLLIGLQSLQGGERWPLAQVFGLSLLRVFLCLLVNSGLQGTRRATCVSPARGQYSKGRAEAVAARDTPSLSSAKMSQVKGHRESQIC